MHTSTEGKILEDPAEVAPEYIYQRTVDPIDAPDTPETVTIGFESGDPVSVNGKGMTPATLLTELNRFGGRHGVGRLDLVENRFIGMKSRGVYETPGGTILLAAHRGIEALTLDRAAAHLKDEIMPRYAELIYNGFWFAPERDMLQALIDRSQDFVSGEVTLRLYKGCASVISRTSPRSLYSADLVTFGESSITYDHHDAEGFIRLNGLRLRSWAARNAGKRRPLRQPARPRAQRVI
ncbi:argininosuccinate synthase [Rhizobium leguminosarum]|nr:argininosuccinate synthase [Rhizobium leguminosarum]